MLLQKRITRYQMKIRYYNPTSLYNGPELHMLDFDILSIKKNKTHGRNIYIHREKIDKGSFYIKDMRHGKSGSDLTGEKYLLNDEIIIFFTKILYIK